MAGLTTHTLEVPGAVLIYDVRPAAGPGSDHAHALAEELGGQVVPFPSHHGGFLGGEYGQAGDPDPFAATLRTVLAEGRPRA